MLLEELGFVATADVVKPCVFLRARGECEN